MVDYNVNTIEKVKSVLADIHYPSRVAEVADEFRRTFHTLPDKSKFPTYRSGYVIDENQSVKWNREQVKLAEEAYAQEKLRLFQVGNEADSLFRYKLKELICENNNISEEEYDILYLSAYQTYHAYGWTDTIDGLEDLVDMYNRLLEVRLKEKMS